MRRLLLLIATFALLQLTSAKPKKKKTVKLYREIEAIEEVHSGPVETCVWDKELVTEGTRTKHVIEHHAGYHQDTEVKNFKGPSLAYVTPWNGKGYDIAKQFRCKFTLVSPVWYQLQADGKELKITGGHDVDAGWLQHLKKGCSKEGSSPPRVVPRVLSELPPRQLLDYLLFPQPLIKQVIQELKAHEFDGMVFECWTQWASLGLFRDGQYRDHALKFLQQLGSAVRKEGMTFILAVPPAISAHPGGLVFTPTDFAAVRGTVDGVSLMTYDYSLAEAPGPNAPIAWVEENLQALLGQPDSAEAKEWGHKVLMGLNFYGREFVPGSAMGGMGADMGMGAMGMAGANPDSSGAGTLPENNPILGSTYTQLLEEHRSKLTWDPRAAEHFFKYKKEAKKVATVWFPTLKSIQRRLELATQYSAGISIWEIGQGLDYFYDLL